MIRDSLSVCCRIGLLVMISAIVCAAITPSLAEPPAQIQFENKVLPILKEHCFKCHGDMKSKGGLKLTSRESLLEGGDSGLVIDLKNPAGSVLLKAIYYHDELKMPPSGKLPEEKVKVLEVWIKDGVPWSVVTKAESSSSPNSPLEKKGKSGLGGGVVTPEARKYWAYQPVRPATELL